MCFICCFSLWKGSQICLGKRYGIKYKEKLLRNNDYFCFLTDQNAPLTVTLIVKKFLLDWPLKQKSPFPLKNSLQIRRYLI